MADLSVATVAAEPLEQAFEEARQGSREARLAFFDTYAPVFLDVIRAKMDKKLRSAWDSADFMQECRLDLLRHDFVDMGFETPQAFLAYLLDIAKHGVLQAKRKMQRQKRGGGQADKPLDGLSQAEQEQLVDNAPQPDEAAALEESWRRVLAQLPLVYRHIAIGIRELKTHEEIALEMNLSVRTVGRVLCRIQEAWLAEEKGN